MKKILSLLLIVIFITSVFLGCNGNSDITTTIPDNQGTTLPDSNINCEVSAYFRNLNDFYTYALTESRDPSLYTDELTQSNIHWYPNVSSTALLKIEDLFDDKNFISDIKEIILPYEANNYTYVFNSGIMIDIKYNPKISSSSFDLGEEYTYITETDKNVFASSSDKDTVYVTTVDGTKIYRRINEKTEYYILTMYVDGFEVEIRTFWVGNYSSHEELLNDPKNQCIKKFFTDELSSAVSSIKENIGKSTLK